MKNNKTLILSIGDEILIGQINNTNATWMADLLNKSGFDTIGIHSIGDSGEEIKKALDFAHSEANLVLITGGLGPTKDDVTKKAVCEYFNSQLVINKYVLEHVEEFFKKRNRELTELNRLQAMVPDNCTAIFNAVGTAPGMYFEKNDVHYIFMPGVPFEMKNIMEYWVIPQMSIILKTDSIYQKTILTHGMGESFLAAFIENWEDNLPPHISLAYLPSPGKVRLRLRAKGNNYDAIKNDIEREIAKLKQLIPELIFGFDEDTMEAVVGDLLKSKNKSLSTAESCTGGYIAHKITEVAGSSAYFSGSIISYSNEAKVDLLDVSSYDLQTYGAVSEQVAIQMAKGARTKFKTDFAIATTGIAGPEGGTIEKPVGTVWIAFAAENKCYATKFQFGDHRLRNINMTTLAALNMLRLELLKN